MKTLLIEDNPGDARLIQELLKETRGKFTVSVAEKLGLGIELLLSQDVDVVLMDLNLPDSRGLETLTKVQTRFSRLPIVIMTSLDDEELAHQAVRLGAQDYLVKGSVNGELLRRTLAYSIERKQAEETLRKAHDELELRVQERTKELDAANRSVKTERQRLYDVLETLPVYVVLLTPDYHVPFANRFFRERFGESGGKRCYEYLFNRAEPCEVCETYSVLKTGAPHHWEWTGPDGRNYDIHDYPFADADGATLILEMGIDITEQKKAERELRDVNQTLEQRVIERTAELLATNETLRASRLASLNLMEDAVAARKDTEKANLELRRSAERFELLAATAGELLQAPDPQKAVESLCTRVMTYVDCHAFFNFLVDEQAGKLHLNACAGIREEEAKRIEWLDYGVAVCGCAARDGTRIVAEHIPTTPDPRTELVKSYGIKAYCCHPLLGPGGKVIGTLSFGTKSRETFSDDDLSLMKAVTDQVAAAMTRMSGEKALLNRTSELEELNKELESFAYSISHDLRAPLRTIAGFVKIIMEDYPDKLDAQGKDYLARIRKGSERMSQLIDDLLRLSKISRQDVDLLSIDLGKLAESAVLNLRESAPGRTVEIVIAEGVRALVDPNLMRVALMNLIDNAWKFTSKVEKARIEFGIFERDGKTIYFVKDNGVGFDPQFSERMFMPFHRLHTDKEFEGSGIGLAIVERVIRRHGGKVWAEGEVGKGATVFFTL